MDNHQSTYLYALMKHFLFQPVHDILEKRKQEIESDFALANQQKQEALESKNKANQQLENMQTICDGMLADAKRKKPALNMNKLLRMQIKNPMK